jgi:hypothetical protein
MRETWPWQLAVDSAVLTLLTCDLATRGEVLAKVEIDLLALARSQADAAEFVDLLKIRLNEIGSIGSQGVWWDKLASARPRRLQRPSFLLAPRHLQPARSRKSITVDTRHGRSTRSHRLHRNDRCAGLPRQSL